MYHMYQPTPIFFIEKKESDFAKLHFISSNNSTAGSHSRSWEDQTGHHKDTDELAAVISP